MRTSRPNVTELRRYRENDALKRAVASGPRIGVPMNLAPAERWPILMTRRPETTTINIDHQLVRTPIFTEYLMESGILSDIPKRLGVMQGNHAVILGGPAIPRCAVANVGADKCCDLEHGLSGEALWDYVWNDHIAVGLELLPVLVLDAPRKTRRSQA